MAQPREKGGLLLFAALAFYAGLAAFYFHDALFTRRVQICSDTILSTYPWVLSRPPDFKPRNLAISDQCTVFYPWFHYTAERMRAGEIPLWTPHVLGGVPYLGNLSTAIFYPLNLLLLLLSVNTFFLVQSLVKVAAAGFFTFLLLRKLGLRFSFALFGGTVYACSGFTVLWVISNLTSVAVLLPLMLYATEVFLERRDGPAFSFLALLLGIQFLGAQPETSLCVTAAWALYALARVYRRDGFPAGRGLRATVYLALAGLLGLGLVLFQLWPFLEYLSLPSWGLVIRRRTLAEGAGLPFHHPLFTAEGLVLVVLVLAAGGGAVRLLRRRVKGPGRAFLHGMIAGALLWAVLATLLRLGLKPSFLTQFLPDLYGNPLGGARTAGGAAYPEFAGGYAGVLPLLLAGVGFWSYRRSPPTGVLGLLFLLFYGTAQGLPVVAEAVRALPLFDLCQPGRMLAVSTFAVAVLAAFGLEAVLVRLCRRPGLGGGFAKALGAAAVLAAPPAVLGFHAFDAGGLPFAGRSVKTAGRVEGRGPEELLRLDTPRPGRVFTHPDGLYVEGTVAPGVWRLTFFLDGIGIGSVEPPGPAETRRFRFPEGGEERFSLERIREGAYTLSVRIESRPGKGAAYLSIPVVIRHPKELRPSNLAAVLVSLAALCLLFLRRVPGRLRVILALAVAVGDLAHFGMGYNVTTEPDRIFPDNPVCDFLSSRKGVFRILPENVILQPSTNYMYGYQILRGYDGLEVPDYNRVINMMKRSPWVRVDRYNAGTLDYESPFLDLLNVRYIVTEDRLEGIPGLRPVFDARGRLRVYENTEALPRAFVVGRWIDVGPMPRDDLDAALAYVREALRRQGVAPEVLADTKALLEVAVKHTALLDRPAPFAGGGTGTAEIEAYENEYVRVKVSMKGEGVLILADNWFPGWTAAVDGRETEILKSLCFRAVPLGDGEHRVEFRYRPASFYLGYKLSLACLALLMLFAFVPRLTAPLRRSRGGARHGPASVPSLDSIPGGPVKLVTRKER